MRVFNQKIRREKQIQTWIQQHTQILKTIFADIPNEFGTLQKIPQLYLRENESVTTMMTKKKIAPQILKRIVTIDWMKFRYYYEQGMIILSIPLGKDVTDFLNEHTLENVNSRNTTH